MRRLRRWFRPGIDWSTFGHTAHWLQGIRLVSYILHEEYAPSIREQLNSPNLLLSRLR